MRGNLNARHSTEYILYGACVRIATSLKQREKKRVTIDLTFMFDFVKYPKLGSFLWSGECVSGTFALVSLNMQLFLCRQDGASFWWVGVVRGPFGRPRGRRPTFGSWRDRHQELHASEPMANQYYYTHLLLRCRRKSAAGRKLIHQSKNNTLVLGNAKPVFGMKLKQG